MADAVEEQPRVLVLQALPVHIQQSAPAFARGPANQALQVVAAMQGAEDAVKDYPVLAPAVPSITETVGCPTQRCGLTRDPRASRLGEMSTQTDASTRIWSLIYRLLSSDWVSAVLQGWQLLQKISTERAVGLYEVLDFEHTLELLDPAGEQAVYHKRETVRLLQDHVAAYVDYTWGREDIFAEYRCSPGVPADRYPCGHKTCVLISLREAKRRGDIVHISIDRTVRDGFDLSPGWSETVVHHRTHRFLTAVIFPRERPPKRVALLQVNQNCTVPLGETHLDILPDGRQRVFWKTTKPRLFETYTLKWTW